MSNYTKTTNFAAKDSLPSGSAGKIIKGTEHDTEYNNIATAISTKLDAASGSVTNLTGVSGSLSHFSFSSGTISNLITDLSVSDGGTGLSFATAGTVLLGNGSSSFLTLAAGATGEVVLSNGSSWYSGVPPTGFSNMVVLTSGQVPQASQKLKLLVLVLEVEVVVQTQVLILFLETAAEVVEQQ
jgi:hypothetical protein